MQMPQEEMCYTFYNKLLQLPIGASFNFRSFMKILLQEMCQSSIGWNDSSPTDRLPDATFISSKSQDAPYQVILADL